MSDKEVWYFAYGSNLNIGQMVNRVGEWAVSKRAVIKGYKLVFNVQSKRWGGLAANVVRTGNTDDKVYGAVYRILKEKLDVLTHYEGVEPRDTLVEADAVMIPAKVYVFETSRKPGRPPDAHLEVMLSGFRQHAYSEEVIEEVKKAAKSQ
ncbi:MAG: gamma-glutamylcyclotransferase [Dehalococcoidia bacterium]|nr:gamma-glutamylcyclotransferase [Dehalococcoidia bacterium]